MPVAPHKQNNIQSLLWNTLKQKHYAKMDQRRRSGGQVWNQQRSNLALGGYEKIPDVEDTDFTKRLFRITGDYKRTLINHYDIDMENRELYERMLSGTMYNDLML